jgi:hypothetical protein
VLLLLKSFTSTVTASQGAWNGTSEDQTAFISPLAGPIVVLGQVMTCNDTGYSTFWSSSSDRNTPALIGLKVLHLGIVTQVTTCDSRPSLEYENILKKPKCELDSRPYWKLQINQSVNSKNSVEANMQQYAKGAPNHCCYDDNSESGGEFQGT